MIYKRKYSKVSVNEVLDVKFLYSSKFDLTAKSLVTNSVAITRALCIKRYIQVSPGFGLPLSGRVLPTRSPIILIQSNLLMWSPLLRGHLS